MSLSVTVDFAPRKRVFDVTYLIVNQGVVGVASTFIKNQEDIAQN